MHNPGDGEETTEALLWLFSLVCKITQWPFKGTSESSDPLLEFLQCQDPHSVTIYLVAKLMQNMLPTTYSTSDPI
jgi:hypothetical protein